MSEAIGPQTKAMIRKMRHLSSADTNWGKRSLLAIPWGIGLFLIVEFALYAALGFKVKGWDGLLLIVPVLYGIPVIFGTGMVLAVIGLGADLQKRPAVMGLVFWLLVMVAWAVFIGL